MEIQAFRKNSVILSADTSFRQKLSDLLSQQSKVTKEEYETLKFNFFASLSPYEHECYQKILNDEAIVREKICKEQEIIRDRIFNAQCLVRSYLGQKAQIQKKFPKHRLLQCYINKIKID